MPPHQPGAAPANHDRSDHRATPHPGRQRTRRRTTHPRLAPPTPPPAARLTRLDKPPPPPRRPRPTHTPETTQILLHPIRRPTAKRALASRLHPLAAGQRHHHRNPVLARRLLTRHGAPTALSRLMAAAY